jgi:hypothetical protein
MSLVKTRMTPARWAANRRNAPHSTGPRTERGKANSRLNALRHSGRSRLYLGVLDAVTFAPRRPSPRQPVTQPLLAVSCGAQAEPDLSLPKGVPVPPVSFKMTKRKKKNITNKPDKLLKTKKVVTK